MTSPIAASEWEVIVVYQLKPIAETVCSVRFAFVERNCTMRKRLFRLVPTAVTLLMGVAIGIVCGQSAWDRDARANERAALRVRKVARHGSVIGVKRETLDRYIELHADVWPGVLKRIEQCNIHNYSIYLGELDDGNLYLFAYYEYTGDDFEADMKKMAADPTTRQWWKETDPLQIPQKKRKPGEHWMTMREVFHCD